MNNIRLGNGKASDEDVKRAARQVKLHDYIESLPDGYETSVLLLHGRSFQPVQHHFARIGN